ncbi:gem-associated protein 4b [Drosophila virilis]|uniref:Uncharacterized protein n=1 Tax=Drosophila virilis TaxID=7244 RepID=B4MB20_DROVI|nr:uncharacterized protein LOC6634722 [Drosophila virilis]EDW66429.1 uncharacterized protein Dvir_GJ16027 [Drosophila virilis]
MHDLRALNNCEVFKQIRVELVDFHTKTKRLNSFIYFSGNEENIRNVADRVLHVLLEHGLVEQQSQPSQLVKPNPSADLDQLRGTLMYLILNSVVGKSQKEEQELARWNPQCVHLLKQFPEPLPQLLTVSVLLLCGLEQMLLEFLACGPHWLTSQYFDCLNNLLGHLVPGKRETLPLIGGALSAVTKAICYQAQSNLSLMDNALRLLQRHLLNSEERLRSLSSKKRQRYLGEAMCQLLDVLLEIMAALQQPPELPAYFMVYALHSPTSQESPPSSLEQLPSVSPQLREFGAKVMDMLQLLLHHISVDTYMAWQEMTSSQLLFHLQAHVGNKCQALTPLLAKDETLKTHTLRAQLANFEDGAQTFEQRLDTLTLGELLSLLDGEMGVVPDDQLLAALNELLRRPICFGNEECVETMAGHIQLLGVAHAELMLEHLGQVLTLHDDDNDDADDCDPNAPYSELLQSVLLPIYQTRCSSQEKLKLLHKRDQLQLLSRFTFTRDNHNSRRIYFFNQLSCSSERFPLDQFLDLCYEEPAQTWLGLAQLAMTHRRFATLYWHVAASCSPHARHHVGYTVRCLLLDERLLSLPSSGDLIVRLYEQPVLLNGMRYRQVIKCRRQRLNHALRPRPRRLRELTLNLSLDALPYSGQQLHAGQDNYLSACAAGLARFSETRNYTAIERLLKTLLSLEVVEQRIVRCSHKSYKEQRRRLTQASEHRLQLARHKLQLARGYVRLHGQLSSWRISNWPLASQIVLVMDQLRGTLENFELARIALLDLVVEYHVNNMARSVFMSPEMRCRMVGLIGSGLQHAQLWKGEQLAALLEDPDKKRETSEYTALLRQASTLEAVNLLSGAIRHKLDGAVMHSLAEEVNRLNSPNAQHAYGFLFKCYMIAFNQELIGGAVASDYPRLIEHILRTPKLRMPENLLAAVSNLKILLGPAGIVGKTSILQYVNQSLAMSAEN